MKLYIFKICPFVEKIKILLNEKNLHCEFCEVNIRSKPEWFVQLTPEATVPLLEVKDLDGKTHFINESSIICDYLDEISDASLYPNDPVKKAVNKLWITRADKLVFDAYHMTHAKSEEEFHEKKVIVDKKLLVTESTLESKPYFNGSVFSMVDIVYAPIFFRFECLSRLHHIHLLDELPKLKVWSENILNKKEVTSGFIETFDKEFEELLHLKKSFLLTQNNSSINLK